MLKEYSVLKEKLIGIISGRDIRLTADCWMSPMQKSYLTVTCHFTHDNILRHDVLNLVKVDGSRLTVYLADNKYDCCIGNILAIP